MFLQKNLIFFAKLLLTDFKLFQLAFQISQCLPQKNLNQCYMMDMTFNERFLGVTSLNILAYCIYKISETKN